MQGRVGWYDPGSRRGRVATQEGRSYSFTLPDRAEDVRGGDVVAFRLIGETDRAQAVDVHVQQSGVDYLNTQQRDLVNEFLSTVTIQR